MDIVSKHQALEFLKDFERTLNKQLPGPTEMESWIRQTVAAAKADDNQKHLRLPEAAFLNGKALPILFDVLQSYGGLSMGKQRRALLNEYLGRCRTSHVNHPSGGVRHPFRKILGASPSDIYQGWANPDKTHALTQSCRWLFPPRSVSAFHLV